jgi:hypothetical protein
MLEGDSTVREVAQRGRVVIGASERLQSEARQALQRFLAGRGRWFGNASPTPSGFRIVLRSNLRGYRQFRAGDPVGTMVLAELPDSAGAARTERTVSPSEITDAALDSYAELMWASAGGELLKWLGVPVPVSFAERSRGTLTMYALVTGTGRAQRDCLTGSAADCAYALGLGPPRRSNVGGTYPMFLRTDLLLVALEAGGPDAWRRFKTVADSGMTRALARAAGMPLDSLLVHWQRGLLALRPVQNPLRASAALLAVGWSGILLLGALRLSRWV